MKNSKAIFKVISVTITLLTLVLLLIFLNRNKAFQAIIDKYNFLSITSYAEKKSNKDNLKTTYFLPKDVPIILDESSPKNIEIIGSFSAENEKILGDEKEVIKIKDGYKGNISFGNVEGLVNIEIKNPNISILSIDGSGDNSNVSTYVKLKGSFNFTAKDNTDVPLIELKPGALLFLDKNENTTIKSSDTGVVIGGKKQEDAGHLIIDKLENLENVFLIKGDHIGSGKDSYFSGTIFSNDGDTPLKVNTIGGYLKTPENIRQNLVMLLPSDVGNNDKIDLININNYLVFDYADNVLLNEIETKNLSFECIGNENVQPYTDINKENTSLVAKLENILMEEDKNIIKPIKLHKNTNYVYAISTGDISIKPEEQAENTFDEISLNMASGINSKVSISAHEFYTNLEIVKVSEAIMSGYDRLNAIGNGTILRIKNPSKDENPNAQPLKQIGIITENLDFDIVDINGNDITEDQSLFDLDNGEYIDVIVELKKGLPMGSYTTNVIVTESTVKGYKPSIISVNQDVNPGKGSLYFEIDGNKESISAVEGEEGSLVSIKDFKPGGIKEPTKAGYLFQGWSYEERFIEGDYVTLENGDIVLHAKFVKIEEVVTFSYEENINIYIGESSIEDITNAVNLKGSLKDFSNRDIEIDYKIQFEEDAIHRHGVHEISIFLKTKDMEEFVQSKKVSHLYVLNKPALTLYNRIIVDSNSIIPSNGSLWNPIGENEVANHILKAILKETVEINFDSRNLDQNKMGDHEVGFLMEYTDIKGEIKELSKNTSVTVVGVSISNIEPKQDDDTSEVSDPQNETIKKSTEQLTLWSGVVARLKTMNDKEIWSIEKNNFEELGELKGNVSETDKNKNIITVNTSEYIEKEIKEIEAEVFTEIKNHEKAELRVINGNLTLIFNTQQVNPLYNEEEKIDKYSINYTIEKDDEKLSSLFKNSTSYMKLNLKGMKNFPLKPQINIFLPEELSSTKPLYLYEYKEENNELKYRGRVLNLNSEGVFSLNNISGNSISGNSISGVYIISDEYKADSISKNLINNNINIEKSFEKMTFKEKDNKILRITKKILNLNLLKNFKDSNTSFINKIIIFTTICGVILSIMFVIKFIANWTRKK